MKSTLAITINSLMGRSFPVSIAYRKNNNTHTLEISPVSLREIVDIIRRHGDGYYCTYGIDHYYWEGKTNRALSLKEVCLGEKIKAKFIDDETIMLRPKQLHKLINEINHYNFQLIGFNELPGELDVIECCIDATSILKNGNTVIGESKGDLFLSSHDDCYLYIECKELELIKDVVNRLITNMILSSIGGSIRKIHIDDKIFDYVLRFKTLTIIEIEEVDIANKWLVYSCRYPFSGNDDKAREFKESLFGKIQIDYTFRQKMVKLADFT